MNYKAQQIPVLNGVRGLAIFVVFLSHASNIYFGGAITGWGGGQLGVMLFFVLSGFLMAHLYMNVPPSFTEVRRFVVNRMARIYPMFVLVVGFCFSIKRLGFNIYAYPISTLSEMIEHLAFVRGYEVLWTIGPEVIFYGLFVIAWLLRVRSEASMWSYLLVLTILAWIPLEGAGSNSLAELHDKLPFFLVGTVLGMHSDSLLATSGSRAVWKPWAFWSSLTVFALGFPRILCHVVSVPTHLAGDPWPHPWGYPFYICATVALFAAALIHRPWVLTNALAQFAGKISYSFYLLHYMVLKNIRPLMPTHPLRAIALAGLITVALSWAAYRLIETPSRRFFRRFSRPAATVAVEVA